MDAPVVEIDPNFEPQIRARSNTWPRRPTEEFSEGAQGSPSSDDPGLSDHSKDVLGIKQKTSSRRNAWGNLSYADLITKAIQSSPDQRLTLSQIYDWMVQNVPYFKDKGDNTSSAGWKNSIRHNLSLHSRFMRIQNEGTGKSSWWVINPDAKPGKAPRRRAGSMETKSLEKKRGRIKKRIEAIRAAQENGTVPTEDFSDLHYNFSLSPEFRTRAGSNASSCGRLSPIQAVVEPDLHDGQVPPMSPIPWGSEIDSDNFNTNSNDGSYSIVDSLVGGLNIKEAGSPALSDQNDIEMNSLKLMSGGSMIQYNSQNNFEDSFGNLPNPPSYNDHLQQQQNSSQSVLNLDSVTTPQRTYTNMTSKQMDMFKDNMMVPQQHQMLPSSGMASQSHSALGINTQLASPGRSPQLSPSSYNQPHGYNGVHSPQPIKRSPQQIVNQQHVSQQPHQPTMPISNTSTKTSLLQQCLEAPDDRLLRAALTQSQLNPYQNSQVVGPQSQNRQQMQQPQFGLYNNMYTNQPLQSENGTRNLNNINNNSFMTLQSSGMNSIPQQTMNVQNISQMQQMESVPGRNTSLAEIDTDSMLDLDYDVQQIINHELALDSNLDFNFDTPSSQGISASDSHNLVL